MANADDYTVLPPGALVTVEGVIFDCTDAELGERYRIRGTYRDRNPNPPAAPPGTIHFTGELVSNDYEVQNLDQEWEETRKEALQDPNEVLKK